MRVKSASATSIVGGRVNREGWFPGILDNALYLMFFNDVFLHVYHVAVRYIYPCLSYFKHN